MSEKAALSQFARAVHETATTHTDLRPVLIGGSSRSGTTLLASMLGAASRLLAVPEARFKWGLLRDASTAEGQLRLDDAIRHLANDWKFSLWRVDLPASQGGGPDQVSYDDLLRHLVVVHSRSVTTAPFDVWIDHTPGNIRHAVTMSRLIPGTKLIHLVRDGRAVAASRLGLDWGPNDIVRAAQAWMSAISLGLATTAALGPEASLTVRYEDLVRDPEPTIVKLCRFLGVAYEPAMLSGGGYRTSGYDEDQHQRIVGPPDVTRIDDWRSTLAPRQVETFEHLTGDLLVSLGYEPEYGPRARPPQRGDRLRGTVAGAARRATLDRVRRARRRRKVGER